MGLHSRLGTARSLDSGTIFQIRSIPRWAWVDLYGVVALLSFVAIFGFSWIAFALSVWVDCWLLYHFVRSARRSDRRLGKPS
jgi:hypothetical protein